MGPRRDVDVDTDVLVGIRGDGLRVDAPGRDRRERGDGNGHPLAEARAYAAVPGKPGTVAALSNLFSPFDFLAPLALGWIAARFGLETALFVLLLQPLTVIAVAVVFGRR